MPVDIEERSMVSCGRARKEVTQGWTPIVDGELANLRMGVLNLAAGGDYSLATGESEYAIVLVEGELSAKLADGTDAVLGPRSNPFEELPHALSVSRDETVTFRASLDSFLAIGSAPAEVKKANTVITPADVQSDIRGADNWSREVRKVCWSDNTEGNLLLAGETVVQSGNWATIPPHRHQYDRPGEEVPYEEIYFFRFSRSEGYGLIRQFDDEMDQAFTLKTNDAAYMDSGYHPVVCSPGSMMYQLTLMAGPHRISKASLHPDYEYLLDEKAMENQYRP